MISADAIRGYIDLIVLTLLHDQPSYAYALAKTITEISAGEYVIKQTTLYSALKRLEAAGLATSYGRRASPNPPSRPCPPTPTSTPSATGSPPDRKSTRLNSTQIGRAHV